SIYTASLSGSLSFDLLEKGLSKLGLNIGGSVDGIYYAEQLTKKNALGIFHSTKTGVLMTGTAGESEIKKGNLKHGNQLIPQVSVSVQLGEGIISVQDMIGKNPNMSLISYDPTIPIANVSIGLLGTVKDSYNDYPVMKTRTISAGKSLSLKMKTEGIVSGGKEVKRLRTEYKMISHEDYAIKKQQVLFNWYGHYTQEGQ
ncbi:MAG: hypothetical protein JJT78_16255, partial [Leptospira sp.]|nr:hypothetical protein [Leptospira sp.]